MAEGGAHSRSSARLPGLCCGPLLGKCVQWPGHEARCYVCGPGLPGKPPLWPQALGGWAKWKQ